MFSRFFIERPIFAIVLAVAMVMAGALTFSKLPIAQYPDITPPTVMVTASYPGADAATVAETVGVPIEQQVNGVEGMMYMSSSSGSDGSYSLTITFEEGTDLDEAAVKVQNLISQADAQLPTSVKQQGVQVRSESSNQILFIALQSDDPERYDALYLTNYANLNITDELARVEGVGSVGAFGGGQYSMRIWLDPAKMRERNITPADVESSISSQNMQVSAGSVGAQPSPSNEAFTYTLTARGQLSDPAEFGDIILRTDSNGGLLHLKDIARIDLGSVSYTQVARVNGQQSAMIGISQLPGANALDVAKGCEAKLKELKQYFPPGVDYRIMLNTTDFVTASIDELLVTFLETTIIVMLVIMLFLQNWRATIIPMLTIPVSLIATLAVMKWMGFSLNTLTLFGLVLAIAIVVDDAIVVAILLYFVLTGLAFWGFLKWPTTYVPSEDMGYFLSSIQLPTGASLDRTDRVAQNISAKLLELPGVKDVMSVSGTSFMGGGSTSNNGSLFVILEPWKDRTAKDESIDAIMARANEIGNAEQEAISFSLNPPAIPGLGMTSGLEMQLLDINDLGASQLKEALTAIQEVAKDDPRIASVTTMYEGAVPQYSIKIDRSRAKMQGLAMSDIYSALSAFMGGSYVNDFVEFGRVYQVNIAADAAARSHVDDVLKLTVRNATGGMVPFSAFASVEQVMGESSVSRYNTYRTASLTATPAKGVSSADGIKAMEEIVNKAVGNNYSYAWTGEAYQENRSGTTISFVLILAIIVTLLVLAAQYESLTDPVAVITAMPTAILGAVIGCLLMGQSISIYTQIGIILLLGLAAKNAILIVEYAMDYRKAGEDIRQAALDAGRVRFRPIMMTAMAFVFGVLPMLFATGAGAASRISLGTAVVFGMAVNALFGTLFVPNFWELLQRFGEKYVSPFFHKNKGLDKAEAKDSGI